MPGARKAEEAPAEETTAAPAPEAEKSATPSKTEGGSATAEMLALATNPSGGGNSQPASGATPPAAQGAPNQPGASGGMMQQMMRNQGGGRPNMGPGAMGGGSGPNPSEMSKMMAGRMQMQRGQGGPGGPPGAMGQQGGLGVPGAAGMPGGPGGPGGLGRSPADDKPADFRRPFGAVNAFLSALQAKPIDADRLAEACALRASLEPPEKNKTLFKKIFDLSLSDSELDDLAKRYEGYKIAGENPPKSTGRAEVVLQKSGDDGSRYTLVVTVRKEKKGWGVLHLATPTVFKPLGQTPKQRTGGGGGR